jgi:hypothetical protein
MGKNIITAYTRRTSFWRQTLWISCQTYPVNTHRLASRSSRRRQRQLRTAHDSEPPLILALSQLFPYASTWMPPWGGTADNLHSSLDTGEAVELEIF